MMKADEYSQEDEDGFCYMLLCRSILGRVLHCRDVRPKADVLEECQASGWDSLCGDRWAAVGTFREFVLFEPNQVYPAFILRYKPWSEATFCRAIRDASDAHDLEAASRLVPLTAILTDEHPDASVRYRLALLQATHSKLLIPELSRRLSDHRFRVRRASMLALMYLAAQTTTVEGIAQAVPALVESLGDTEIEIRTGAARTLERLGESSSLAVPALTNCLKDPANEMRAAAATALGQLGYQAVVAVPALLLCTSDEVEPVRVAAIVALGNLPPNAAPEPVVRMLQARLDDASGEVRSAAATALGQFGGVYVATVVPDLAARLGDSQADVRKAVAQALGKLGQKAAPAVPALVRSLKDPDMQVRRASATSLGRLGVNAAPAASALADALRDSNAQVRQASAVALGHLGRRNVAVDSSIVQALLKRGLIDANAEVRAASAESLADMARLGSLGDNAELVEKTMAVRVKDDDPNVRASAKGCLMQLRKKDKNDESESEDHQSSVIQLNWRRTEGQMRALRSVHAAHSH
ncbi:unnamed protein product [Polarella glacialis]|uniref:TOG domain-containing protein n=1 Tax=Polarella glacialis TaxID=89957 RepID=A0A813HQF8_POLGL|nr:unnamed protein product [Polarella glacialis]